MAGSTGKIAGLIVKGLGLAGLLLGLAAWPAAAEQPQEELPPAIEIYHEPPEPSELPPPGEALQLSAEILNNRDITMKMEALLVVDGKLMGVPMKNQYLNARDLPEFSVSMQAPLADLSYQFILHLPDGSSMLSERYHLKRPCLIGTNAADLQTYTKLQGEERLSGSIETARKLKLETAAYSNAIALIEELQKIVKE